MFFPTGREVCLRELKSLLDITLADVLDQSLLLEMKEELRIGVKYLMAGRKSVNLNADRRTERGRIDIILKTEVLVWSLITDPQRSESGA